MKKQVIFLFCEKEKDFKRYFTEELLNCSLTYKGIPVTFAPDDFSHICYEKGSGDIPKSKFGIRRARRILIIKQLITEEVPSELLLEEHTGNYCLLCEPLDVAVFLVPIKTNRTLQIGTIIHYGSGFTKAIEKQRGKSKKVDKIEF